MRPIFLFWSNMNTSNNYKHLRKLHSILLVVTVLLFTDCTKQVAGPKGDPGKPGTLGNLRQSVISSLKVASQSWTLNNAKWEVLIFDETITNTVINKGEVILYMQKDSTWWALPHGEKFIFTQYSIEQGIVRLQCTHVHGGVPDRPLDANYRVIVLAPGN